MHPLLSSRLATPVALATLGFWCAFALLFFTIGASPNVTATAAPAITGEAAGIALSVADGDEPQTVTTTKSDRLLIPPRSSPPPPSPATGEPAVLKPAEAIDYAQVEAEHLRGAQAEAPDLCQRHGMHKQYFNVGRRQSWRCER